MRTSAPGEARKLVGYRDSKRIPTAGVGHTGPEGHVGVHYSSAQVDAWLAADLAQVPIGLDKALPWWRGLSDARQDVLASMAFQMGVADYGISSALSQPAAAKAA